MKKGWEELVSAGMLVLVFQAPVYFLMLQELFQPKVALADDLKNHESRNEQVEQNTQSNSNETESASKDTKVHTQEQEINRRPFRAMGYLENRF